MTGLTFTRQTFIWLSKPFLPLRKNLPDEKTHLHSRTSIWHLLSAPKTLAMRLVGNEVFLGRGSPRAEAACPKWDVLTKLQCPSARLISARLSPKGRLLRAAETLSSPKTKPVFPSW